MFRGVRTAVPHAPTHQPATPASHHRLVRACDASGCVSDHAAWSHGIRRSLLSTLPPPLPVTHPTSIRNSNSRIHTPSGSINFHPLSIRPYNNYMTIQLTCARYAWTLASKLKPKRTRKSLETQPSSYPEVDMNQDINTTIHQSHIEGIRHVNENHPDQHMQGTIKKKKTDSDRLILSETRFSLPVMNGPQVTVSTRTRSVVSDSHIEIKADSTPKKSKKPKTALATMLSENDMESQDSRTSMNSNPNPNLKTLKAEILHIQSQFPDHILLVQVGGFYEVYEYCGYMEEIASLLDLNIGGREPRFAGFPTASLNRYVSRLISKGKTVAIVDQVARDTTSNSKAFSREVTRIVTPGTIFTEAVDASSENVFLLAISAEENGNGEIQKIGLAWADVNTGEFILSETTQDALTTEIIRIGPKEILLPAMIPPSIYRILKERSEIEKFIITTIPNDSFIFESNNCKKRYIKFLENMDPTLHLLPTLKSKRDLDKHLESLHTVRAAGALLGYINDVFRGISPYFHVPKEIEKESMLKIDGATMKSLEITRTLRGGEKKGSLIDVIDRTKTATGARLLEHRLKQPSRSLEEINRRLCLVDIFYTRPDLTKQIRLLLSSIRDIERCVQRIYSNNAKPSDLLFIQQGLHSCIKLESMLAGIFVNDEVSDEKSQKPILLDLLQDRQTHEDIISLIDSLFLDTSQVGGKLGLIQHGVSDELDKARLEYQSIMKQAQELKAAIQKQYDIEITLGDDPRDGPYISVSTSTKQKSLQKLEKSKNIEILARQKHVSRRKYRHEEWTRLFRDMKESEERQQILEQDAFNRACEQIRNKTADLIKSSKFIAEIDVAASIADLALEYNYIRPIMVEEPCIDVKAGRHPVVEKMAFERQQTYIENDALIQGEDRVWLLTGPNMGGKSTFLRQCALISIMAQAGFYVPAAYAKLGIVDQIFSRIGSSDNLGENQSTFMVEMKETGYILTHATSRSLIIMDEIGRGTSSQDGLSLACAVLDHLVTVNKSLSLFATHYHELPRLLNYAVGLRDKSNRSPDCKIPGIKLMMTRIMLHENGFSYLYKVQEGVVEKSYGIQVAKLAGLPKSVITTASHIQGFLEARK